MVLAIAGTALASLPVLVSRKRILLNPALFVLAVVVWSVLLKTIYIAIFRPVPLVGSHDLIYVDARSHDFLAVGAASAMVAMAAYVVGYFLMGRRRLGAREESVFRRSAPSRFSLYVSIGLAVACLACFLAYLATSGTEFFAAPFSAKRFQPEEIHVASRFLYLPYYFFKFALVSASLTYATAFLWLQSKARRDERLYRLVFSFAFLLALTLAHFASLRLFALLVVVQVVLLTFYLRERGRALYVGVFACLALASFTVITFFTRFPSELSLKTPSVAAAQPAGAAEPASASSEDGLGPPPQGPATEPAASSVRKSEEPVSSAFAPTSGSGPQVGVEETAAASTADEQSLDGDWANSSRIRRLAATVFEGRYFMDVAKMAHIVQFFPAEHPFLLGTGLSGLPLANVLDRDGASSGTALALSHYLAEHIYHEPMNNITPGFAGELYVNFGWLGLVGGFLLLGGFHRLISNYLSSSEPPVLLAAWMIALIPSTTLILLNSGVVAAGSRAALDSALIFLVGFPLVGASRARGLRGRRATAGAAGPGPAGDLRVRPAEGAPAAEALSPGARSSPRAAGGGKSPSGG